VNKASTDYASTGVSGLDDILAGGLTRGRVFLLEGSPGTGKTTIATQFLTEGASRGEKCLYVTLSETDEEMRDGAQSHGWDFAGIDLFELLPPESLLDEEQQQSLLYSSDLELGPVGPKLRFWPSRRTFWERGIRY
jgi:circadian clock protein KaiC